MTKNSVIYDILLSILYSWSIFQAYTYDAKTQTTGILIYVLVYGGFTFLIRSRLGVITMNGLSLIILPKFFDVPVIHQAGAYFDFQPYIGIIATLFVLIIQVVIFDYLIARWRKFLSSNNQYVLSAIIGILFTVLLTFSISFVPVKPLISG